jgi:hypothetical protein
MSYEENTLEKVYIDKNSKYRRSTQETKQIRGMEAKIILIIISSLGAVHAKSLEALQSLLMCDDKKMKIIGRRMWEVAITRSLEIWRKYSREVPHTEIHRARQMMIREARITEDIQMNRLEEEIEAQINEFSQEANGEANEEVNEQDTVQAIPDLLEEVENGESDDEEIEQDRSQPRVSILREDEEWE